TTALIVVSTIPMIEIGLRIRRTSRNTTRPPSAPPNHSVPPCTLPHHGVDDQHNQRNAERQPDAANRVAAQPRLAPRGLDEQRLDGSGPAEPLEFGGALVPQFLRGDAAGEDHQVHRELARPQVAVEEMDDEDEPDR